jgi:hypothetical protein
MNDTDFRSLEYLSAPTASILSNVKWSFLLEEKIKLEFDPHVGRGNPF